MSVISVIVPVWNRAPTIGSAIDSVLSQQLPPNHTLEVIVVDDGSSDQLQDVLARFGGAVRLIRHTRNLGAAAARNTGCEAASGEYIAFLDSDDRWLPGKLAAQIPFLNDGGYDLSCAAYLLERAANDVVVSPHYQTGALDLSDVVWGCFVSPGSTLLCRSSVFRDVGALDVTLRRYEDWDWLMRVARTRPLGFLAQPLARIEPSAGADQVTLFRALDQLRDKHLPNLSGKDRRHFEAAYHMERSAALYRSGMKFRAIREIAISVAFAPWNHLSLAAVLHNRLATGV